MQAGNARPNYLSLFDGSDPPQMYEMMKFKVYTEKKLQKFL